MGSTPKRNVTKRRSSGDRIGNRLMPISLATFIIAHAIRAILLARATANLGGVTLAEEGDHIGTAEIDTQHRLASLVDGVQGENRVGRTASRFRSGLSLSMPMRLISDMDSSGLGC